MALASMRIWRVDLDVRPEVEAALRAELPADEAARLERLGSLAARRRHTVARGTLRTLLGAFMDQPPRSIVIETEMSGKPGLADAGGLHFNVSHSGDLALICIAGCGPVGVDLEFVRPVPSAVAIARSRFAAAEARFVEEGNPAQADRRFLLCWTRKEAVVKALGAGLSVGLRGFTVPLAPAGGNAAIDEPGGSAARRWLLVDVPLGDDHVAAVALPARESRGETNQRLESVSSKPIPPDHCDEIDAAPLIAAASSV
jgi:4'-phosphopantetheinyl transferase